MTKKLEVIRKINYQCPLGKSEHVLIEFEVNERGKREERNARMEHTIMVKQTF